MPSPVDQLIEQHSDTLQCAYLPLAEFSRRYARAPRDLLGAVCFSAHPGPSTSAPGGAPLAHVAMASLGTAGVAGATCEVWASDSACTYGEHDQVRYAHTDDLLFGVIQLAESDFDTEAVRDKGTTPLQLASQAAYRSLFDAIDTLKFPHILRVWNYVADINGECHGSERYRQFNIGRQDGFLECGRAVTGGVPAASAVGMREGSLTIYFLAGRGKAPIAIENPRQVSAYDYPTQYGVRSPTFSRASIAHLGQRPVLFLSGTASIVGHQSLHIGDVVGQTRETVANIRAMVDEANRVAPLAGFKLAELCYKVYVRDEKDVTAIHDELRRLLGSAARLLFLHADICRTSLAMEIEASAGHPLDFSNGA